MDAPAAPRHGGDRDAWDLTLEASLRDEIRVYDTRLPDGTWANRTTGRPIASGMPDAPWALYLGDGAGYQLLCFDMDAHDGTPAARRRAAHDATVCAGLLESHGIPCLVCASGPQGGRHVWASTLDTLDAADVRAIALGMRAACPSLDPTPLLNPRTGCARPPYSRHRETGRSLPIRGGLDAITTPTAGEREWWALLDTLSLACPAPREDTTAREGGATRIAHDTTGMPCIPGTRRPLPKASAVALDAPIGPGTDASRRLWTVLLGAARAHWTWRDVASLADAGHPGMTHALTERTGGTRHDRPATGHHGARSVLAREWTAAVRHVAASGRATHGDDGDWEAQAAATTDTILSALAAARTDATRARTDAAATDRRTLAALCLLALRAATATIQADVRRLSLMTGLGRQTASASLHRLEHAGRIRLARKGTGPEANTWRILGGNAFGDTMGAKPDTSGYTPHLRRMLAGTTRHDLAHRLGEWLGAASHDACTRRGLGLAQGNRIADTHIAGRPVARLLDRAARRLGTHGTRARRALRYARERLLWRWYLAEVAWMKAPAASKPRRAATLAPPDTARGLWPRMPRDPHGRMDLTRAAARVATLDVTPAA